MTRLTVDGRALHDASAYRGIGTYLRNVLPGIEADPRFDVTVASPPRYLTPDRFHTLEHSMRLPFALRRAGGDVVWSPALDPPRRSKAPFVQTLFDVIPLALDAPDLADERRRWRRYAARIRKAAALIAISRHTADDGMRHLELSSDQLEVVPLGADPTFQPGPALLDEPNVLLVGEFSWRKRFDDAFAAIAALADKGYPHRLRVAGRVAWWIAPALEAVLRAAPRPDLVDLLDYVDDLPQLYRDADVLVFTSRYEGFGLPLLEAMASGTPVVAYANSSVPEVVGDAGVLVPDGDLPALVAALEHVLREPAWRADLAQRGIARASTFSWDAAIAAHAEVFERVANG